MCLNLGFYHLKRPCYIHKMLYVNLAVTMKKKTYSKYTKQEKYLNTSLKKAIKPQREIKRRWKELRGIPPNSQKTITKWQ